MEGKVACADARMESALMDGVEAAEERMERALVVSGPLLED